MVGYGSVPARDGRADARSRSARVAPALVAVVLVATAAVLGLALPGARSPGPVAMVERSSPPGDDDALAGSSGPEMDDAPKDDWPTAQSDDVDDYKSEVAGAFAPYEKVIDLRDFQEVRDFLKRKGVSNHSSADQILQWVPAAIVVRMWPERVQGDVGVDAEGGHVAFNLIQPSSSSTSYTDASFLIVMTLRGDVDSVKVLETGTAEYGAPRVDGLKCLDPEHLLLSWNIDPMQEEGPAYSWGWRDDFLSPLANGTIGDAHDIQWVPEMGAKRSRVWRPSATGCVMQDTVTGATLETLDLGGVVADVNHCQVLEDTPYVVLSSRATNSFTKYDRDSGEEVFNVGGVKGTYAIRDFDGNVHPPATTVFFGQRERAPALPRATRRARA